MSRRGQFILGALAFLIIGLIAIYLLGRLEPYEETLELGAAPEARQDDYLAAQYYLKRQGIEASRADNLSVLDTLPAPGNTLLLIASRENMTPSQADRVLEWASKGGHLLFVAEALYDEETGTSDDLLLNRLGIQQFDAEELDDVDEDASENAADEEQATDSEDADSEADSNEDADAGIDEETQQAEAPADEQNADEQPEADGEDDGEPYPELTKLYLENEDAPAYIDFDTRFHLYDSEDRAHAWANSDKATHMLQMNYGNGLVTVLTDSWIWQNDNIADHDNAWLLWYLTQDTHATLLYNADRDDLASLLGRHFPEALAALALLVLLGLWHVGLRQGPQIAPANRARRQLEEHLRASADFLLRRSGNQVLLRHLQGDILRRARRRHPGFERLGVAEQWQVLSRLSRLPPSAISQAMRPLPKQRLSASEFTRQVAHLQSLRNAL
ncbi:DUF4350 domain-containing protein [Pseudomonas otitidis]|uniref:DUF4350 domain-containing protein n=1 Tax=Metapseudomonas otitidis TaxID=319939 RepID=UPI00244A2D40|nr:DUF4350 domain-containing protein [Pseudomonas otitidis]MDH1107821.1 DUF4350 domain-containing protein [Pseudomonas otitidis]MDH1160706.1 DUF4350 domain-containing protein [Pseudomonas otitidis]MDH1162588.1 DUF4350 domain-containing protein [Pseudomonas otitidis]